VSDDWNALAAGFDDEPDHGLRDPLVRAAWWEVLQPHLPAPPAVVADLACGTGSLTLLLADHGYDVTGVDLAPAMLEQAEAKVGDRARLLLGDVTAPPLPPGSCDVVLARHVLFALPEPQAVLARWVALLRPGGRLLLVEGFWHTGSGLRAAQLHRMLRRLRTDVEVVPLSDRDALWGRHVDDERYLVVSRA
jgi:ubiquinone/menaquinone biosynthesis C-methylase UbiE